MESSVVLESMSTAAVDRRHDSMEPALKIQASQSANSLFEELPIDRSEKQLRLWRFEPTPSTSALELELQVFTQAECPAYTALSYVWGSYDDTEAVIINGHSLRITTNLRDFLEILQTETRQSKQWFWADQISMNQGDVNERDHQVTMMGSIYDAASMVFAYVGPQLKGHGPGHKFHSAVHSNRDPLIDYSDTANALHLLTAEYWARLWIVQELYLATEIVVYHGSQAVSAKELLSTLQNLHDHLRVTIDRSLCCAACDKRRDRFMRAYFARVADLLSSAWLAAGIKNAQRARNDLKTLRTVLTSYFESECSEVRDKIFGLQALVLPSQRIAIDYTRSFDDICLDVLQTLITSEEGNDRAPMAQVPWPKKLIGWIADTTSDPSGYRYRADAACWAFSVAHIVEGIQSWSPWAYQSEDWLWRQWREIWLRANDTAVTEQQKTMAARFIILAASFEDTIRHQAARSISLGETVRATILKKSTSKLETLMKQMEREAESILSTAMKNHGFARNENFVYHPDDWFAPQNRERISTAIGSLQNLT